MMGSHSEGSVGHIKTVVNRSVTLYTSTDKSPIGSPNSDPCNKTLVLFFGWLFAKSEVVEKNVSLYSSRGLDVLYIECKLSHFIWPPSSSQAIIELLQVLKSRFGHYRHFIVHGMSIGAFNYTICLMTAVERPSEFGFFVEKLRGVIFDSITCGSLSRMATGIAVGTTNNRVGRWVLVRMLEGYFIVTRTHTADFYESAVDFFIESPAHIPTLILASRDDPMSDPEFVEDIHAKWTKRGQFKVLYKMWESSSHAGHFRHHPEEYTDMLETFLESTSSLASEHDAKEAHVKSRL